MTHPRYTCPKCGSIDLSVTITTTAVVVQMPDSDEFFVRPDEEADHEWDATSSMFCMKCHHQSCAEEFLTKYWLAISHLSTLDLPHALWWFIENIDADHKDRSDIFFYLRERVRTEAQ